MLKENEKDLQKPADEKLADDALEQVSGGQIELVEDEPMCLTGGTTVKRGIGQGDHHAQ